MQFQFEIHKQTRQHFLSILKKHSIEELNTIPEGFNNNLIWNAGHCLSSQQGLQYGLSGLEMKIDQSFVEKFKKGSSPLIQHDQNTVNQIKTLLLETSDQLKEDYNSGIFKNYNEYQTSYGITLQSIEDAIPFNNGHEMLHLGYMMALSRAL